VGKADEPGIYRCLKEGCGFQRDETNEELTGESTHPPLDATGTGED